MRETERRILKEGEYVVETGATVRETAAVFGVSKSTVHKDLTERLNKMDAYLYNAAKKVLKKNLDERHIRGGLATKKKYEERKGKI